MQHLYAAPTGFALGTVVDTVDPQARGRVQVSLDAAGVNVWAPCVVGSAGNNYGVALLPKIGEIVLVGFLSPDQPFVLGAVWSGRNAMPSDAAPVAQRYAIRTASGTTMLFDDAKPAFSVTMPSGDSLELDDTDQSCTVTVGGTTIKATTSSVTITTSSSVELKTASLTVTASSVNVNAATSQFSGIVQCDTMIANTVIGTSYTPGAGNIW